MISEMIERKQKRVFTNLALASSSGTPMLISWSKRPARRSAGSKESGLFVAPMTMTGLLSVFSQDKSKLGLNKLKMVEEIANTIHAC